MTNELVSVVIPSYNRPDRTQRAIDSVAAQSYSPIELLVVDDGSTPPLAESISLPEDQLVSAELIAHNENQGANVARNTGINAASGDYISFLDSDDEWKRNKIQRQVSKIDSATDSGASYTGVENVDINGKLNSTKEATAEGDLSNLLLRRNVLGTFSSFLVRSRLVDKVGTPNPNLPCYQDWEWYLRLSQETKFTPIPEPLTVRHNEGDQISRDFQTKHKAYPMLKELLCDHADSKHEKRIAVSGIQHQIASAALSTGQYSYARQFFLKSIANNPLNWRSYLYLPLSGNQYEPAKRLKRKIIRIIY